MNFYYYCPAVKKPTGGVKVIYQHVQALNEMGVNAWVVHPKSNFKCTWFEHSASIWNGSSISTNDHLVIPETDTLNLAELLSGNSIKYSIFVQNGYFIPQGNNPYAIKMVSSVYENAQSILSISDDTSELIAAYFPSTVNNIIRVQPAIERNLFCMGSWKDKENVITYMPRKNSDHAEKVIFGIQAWLPANWRIQPIHKVSELDAANFLRNSKIFLSFSSFEGFGLPPLEAALSGNYVIGYHGNGGKEYWTNPVFEEIYPYDIKSYIAAVRSKVEALERMTDDKTCCGDIDWPSAIERLSNHCSTDAQKKLLSKFVERSNSLSQHGDVAPGQVTIQHSSLVAWLIRKKRKFNRQMGK